jgi:type III secretory pathway component EscV
LGKQEKSISIDETTTFISVHNQLLISTMIRLALLIATSMAGVVVVIFGYVTLGASMYMVGKGRQVNS